MKFKIIILLIVFISKQVLAVDLKKEIAEILNSQSSRPFNGVILIAKGKEYIYERAEGTHSVPKINSQFVVASISKQITATITIGACGSRPHSLGRPYQFISA